MASPEINAKIDELLAKKDTLSKDDFIREANNIVALHNQQKQEKPDVKTVAKDVVKSAVNAAITPIAPQNTLTSPEAMGVGQGVIDASTFGGMNAARKGAEAVATLAGKAGSTEQVRPPTKTESNVGTALAISAPVMEGMNAIKDSIVMSKKVLSPARQLLLSKSALKALEDSKEPQYKLYEDTIKQGLSKNPNVTADLTDTLMDLKDKFDKGLISKSAYTAIKNDPLLGNMIKGRVTPILKGEEIDVVIKRLKGLGGKSGSNKQPVRELATSIYDSVAEQLPELKQAKTAYREFMDNYRNAVKELGSYGRGAFEPYKSVNAQEAIQNTVGVGNPTLIGELQTYRDIASKIANFKKIAKTSAKYAGLTALGGGAVGAYKLLK